MDAFGSNPNPEGDQLSDSLSPAKKEGHDNAHILVVEDSPADIFLIRQTISATELDVTVHVVKDGEAATNFFDNADADDAAPAPAW